MVRPLNVPPTLSTIVFDELMLPNEGFVLTRFNMT